jgi:hypothetical protein
MLDSRWEDVGVFAFRRMAVGVDKEILASVVGALKRCLGVDMNDATT